MIRVLFVCLGNICRSPMAEALLLHEVREAELEGQIEVDSAGTGDWHIGQPPHKGTLDVLRRNGVAVDSRARQIIANDLGAFDYLIVMDDKNLANIQAMAPGRAHVARLLDYLPDRDKEVADPYFTGDFDATYALVKRGCHALLEHIRAAHRL